MAIPSIDEIPKWVEVVSIPSKPKTDSVTKKNLRLNIDTWKWFSFNNIFDDIQIAKSIDLNKLVLAKEGTKEINYVGRTSENNGVTARVLYQDKTKGFINKRNCIVVPMVGESTCYALFQNSPFYASQNVLVLRASKLNIFNALFINKIIELERFRFSYGRTLTKSFISQHSIRLPSVDNRVDWLFVEEYIKSLPYSSNL